MSGHNADFSIPRGDRDDYVPPLPPEETVTARKPIGDIDGDIAALQASIDEAQLALGELRLARAQANEALAKAAAWRLTEALMVDLRAISTRVRRIVLAERTSADPARAA